MFSRANCQDEDQSIEEHSTGQGQCNATVEASVQLKLQKGLTNVSFRPFIYKNPPTVARVFRL